MKRFVLFSKTCSVDPNTVLAANNVAPRVSDDAPGTVRRRMCPPLKATGVRPRLESEEVEGAVWELELLASPLKEDGESVADVKSKAGLSPV